MPTRPAADGEAIPVGDEADAAGCADVLLVMFAQVPEADPTFPPPSKSVDEPDVPGVDIPVPEELPVSELVLDKFPAIELTPVQVAVLSVAGPSGETPDVIGLTPGDASSVAPKGIPVGATAGAGPMPSGDVIPSGDGAGDIPPTCAEAEPQPKSAAAIAAINKRVILDKRVI